jgi:hypothetical protein
VSFDFVERCRKNELERIETLESIYRNSPNDSARIQAIALLNDRARGKAAQPIIQGGGMTVEVIQCSTGVPRAADSWGMQPAQPTAIGNVTETIENEVNLPKAAARKNDSEFQTSPLNPPLVTRHTAPPSRTQMYSWDQPEGSRRVEWDRK